MKLLLILLYIMIQKLLQAEIYFKLLIIIDINLPAPSLQFPRKQFTGTLYN